MIWYLFMKFGVNYGNSMPVNIGGGSEGGPVGDKIVYISTIFLAPFFGTVEPGKKGN
jgi:hypothetical protein